MNNKPVIVIGNGGHASVLTEILQLQHREILGFTAPEQQENRYGLNYLGQDNKIKEYMANDIELVLGLGTVYISYLRKNIFEEFKSLGYTFASILHPNTIISQTAIIGEGVQIMAGAIIQAYTEIADNTIVNTGTIIDHDCKINAHTHVAPGVRMSGGVKIGCSCHIGTGATIIQGISVGANSLIGAGAVVVSNIANDKKAIGIPAKEV